MADDGACTSVNAVHWIIMPRKFTCRIDDVPLVGCAQQLRLARAANGWRELCSRQLLPICISHPKSFSLDGFRDQQLVEHMLLLTKASDMCDLVTDS